MHHGPSCLRRPGSSPVSAGQAGCNNQQPLLQQGTSSREDSTPTLCQVLAARLPQQVRACSSGMSLNTLPDDGQAPATNRYLHTQGHDPPNLLRCRRKGCQNL